MAKDLPWFKFICSEWNDGDITLEDMIVQGVFINICSYYWSKECNVETKNIYKRFKNFKSEIDILVSNEIINDLNGFISIRFLDEQREQRLARSRKNSENAKSRWVNVNALQKESKPNAIKSREEKEIDNTTFTKKSLNDLVWLESVAIKNKISVDNVKKGLNEFDNHLITQKKQHNNYKEFCSHFSNWVSIRKSNSNNNKKLTF